MGREPPDFVLAVEWEQPAAELRVGREQPPAELGVEREQPSVELGVQAEETASAAVVDLERGSGMRERRRRHRAPRRERIYERDQIGKPRHRQRGGRLRRRRASRGGRGGSD